MSVSLCNAAGTRRAWWLMLSGMALGGGGVWFALRPPDDPTATIESVKLSAAESITSALQPTGTELREVDLPSQLMTSPDQPQKPGVEKPPQEIQDSSVSVKSLVGLLDAADLEERRVICRLLSSMRDSDAVPELIVALREAVDPIVEKTLRQLLDRSMTSDGVLALVSAYAAEEDPMAAERVLSAISQLSARKATSALIGLEGRPEVLEDVRLSGAIWTALGSIASSETLGVLARRASFSDTGPEVRAIVVERLRQVSSPTAVPALISLATGNKDSASTPVVQMAALQALVENFPAEEWRPSLPLFQASGSIEVREYAGQAMMRKGKFRVRATL